MGPYDLMLCNSPNVRSWGSHRGRATASLMDNRAVAHMVTSLLGLIEWWLARGLEPDVDQMAEIYDRLIIQATWQALLNGPPLSE